MQLRRAALAEVDVELREALADLREVAHGIYPTELAEGLAAGVAVLAEGAPIPLDSSRDARSSDSIHGSKPRHISRSPRRRSARRATKATVRVDRSR